ncbi:MAG: hypothetical protein Q7R83_01965 [bacterium]|nr:hypothetical protein [bacterium]
MRTVGIFLVVGALVGFAVVFGKFPLCLLNKIRTFFQQNPDVE